jgi:hypothetical protein
MNISRKIVLFIFVLGVGLLLALIWGAHNERSVSLLFHGFETNRDGFRDVFAARIEFTNSTRRTVRYEGNSQRPEYKLLEASSGVWKVTDDTAMIIHMGTMASVPRPCTLLPSRGIVFRVWLPDESHHDPKLRKVEITHSYAGPTNGIWRITPQWVWRRLSWGKDRYTIQSPTFTW